MTDAAKRDVTDLLLEWRQGNEAALTELVPKIYGQLKRMASVFLRRERQDHTLQTTALVHEAYLRLIEINRVSWQDRTHFFAISAQLMRRVLVDHARYHTRAKRGAGAFSVSLDEISDLTMERPPDLVALDDALRDLASRDPETARIVELRFFGGLNREEIADVLGIASATVTRRWRMARAWLLHVLAADGGEAAAGWEDEDPP